MHANSSHTLSCSHTSSGLSPGAAPYVQLAACSEPLYGCICRRDIAGTRYWLVRGVDPNAGAFSYTMRDGTVLFGLTATALAVVVDSDHDGILMTSLILNYGGCIEHVDDEGRSLLALASSHALSTYLAEWGAAPTVGEYRRQSGPWRQAVPRGEWGDVLRKDMVEAMVGAGYHEPRYVRLQRDPFTQPFAPDLVARFSPSVEIEHALLTGNLSAIARLLELGAADEARRYPWPSVLGGRLGRPMTYELTIAALAVVLDCAAERSAVEMPGADRIPVLTSIVLPWVNGSGVHTSTGETLLHLADAVGVSAFLIANGCPVDIPDDSELLPEDVVSQDVRPGLVRARLISTFPQGTPMRSPVGARL